MHGHFPLHPLGHPNYAALRVRCVARSGGSTRKLGATHLRHREHHFPASPALLARVDGDLGAVQCSPVVAKRLEVNRYVPALQRITNQTPSLEQRFYRHFHDRDTDTTQQRRRCLQLP